MATSIESQSQTQLGAPNPQQDPAHHHEGTPGDDQDSNSTSISDTIAKHPEQEVQETPPNLTDTGVTNRNVVEPGRNLENGDVCAIGRPSQNFQISRNENDNPQQAEMEDPPRPLKWWSVASLIINKMIGTGIFTTPPLILALTGKKSEALGLWVAGFFYTIVSMTLYLEYARKLPHTGGELIYLDEAFPQPRLFAYTLYATLSVFLANSSTNSMQFANQVLISASSHPADHQRILRFIAFAILTMVCLLHYFSAAFGRRLNTLLALSKLIMLLVVIIAGGGKARKADFNDISKAHTTPASSSAATAFLYILFSFQGWENATFVAGEIATHRTLKIGFISAVVVVGLMYVSVNLVFFYAIPYEDINSGSIQFVPMFFGNGTTARRAWAVLIAISAVGNLVSVTYTASRVKQSIGWAKVLPWSRLWVKESNFKPPTPSGGLLLHWFNSLVLIAISAAVNKLDEAISLPGLLQAYSEALVGVFVGFGYPLLAKRQFPLRSQLRKDRIWTAHNEARFLRSGWSKWPLAVLYVLFNLAIIAIVPIKPYKNADKTNREVLGWYFVTIICAILGFSICYYFVVLSTWQFTARAGGITPSLDENNVEHHPQYGFRRYVTPHRVNNPNSVQNFLYHFFDGSLGRYFNFSLSDLWPGTVKRHG